MDSVATDIDPALISEGLEDVLKGPSFRSSKQCQTLLRYIVEQTLAGNDDLLRERVIGAEVFGRPPDYDTGNDPVVRSRVGEVRKRLAQHYMQLAGVSSQVRIYIPSGSYHAMFEIFKPAEAGALLAAESQVEEKHAKFPECEQSSATLLPNPIISSTEEEHLRIRASWTAALIALVLLAGAGIWFIWHRQTASEKLYAMFWAPLSQSSKPVIVYIGGNYTYRLSTAYLDRYRAEHHLPDAGPEFFINLQPGNVINEKDLIPTNRLIGFGDVASACRLVSILTRFHRVYDFRYGNDIAVPDLRSAPAIFIGGFSNAWTMEVTDDLRYSLEHGDRIVDKRHPEDVWIRGGSGDGLKQDDYALITRLSKSETGDFVLAIGGIDTYGNQAAADFLNNPEQLGAVLKNLPPGWDRKNLQIVLHTGIVNDVPASADVVAVYSW